MKRKEILVILYLISSFFINNALGNELEWPLVVSDSDNSISIYQPQVESLDFNSVTSRSAFSVSNKSKDKTSYGVLWSVGKLQVDKANRVAHIDKLDITDVKLPESSDAPNNQAIVDLIEKEFAESDYWMPLDQLIATMDEVKLKHNDELSYQAPTIILKDSPSVLIQIDGEPSPKEISSGLSQIMNTSASLFYIEANKTYYIWTGKYWFAGKNLPSDNWTKLDKTPKMLVEVQKQLVENDDNQEDEIEESDTIIPQIIVTTKTSELLVTDGKMSFSNIDGTDLLYVSNTDSDLFLDVSTQSYFVLISGRWFTTKDTAGDWKSVKADELPSGFSQIPENSAKGNVLISVAGTNQAIDAIHDAQIPQTAEINRETATADAEYYGDAEFKKVENTDLSYAVNTNQSVFKTDKEYFLCEDGVWYRSSSPNGPWVASEVRPNGVESLPPTNPHYNTKFVYIYDVRPRTIVTGYTQGYLGGYFDGFTLVYGTGYNHSSWYRGYYFSRPATYGYSVSYSPWYGWSVGFNLNFGSPFSWYSRGWWWSHRHRPHYHHHHGGWGHRPGRGGWGHRPGNGGWGYHPGNGGWGYHPGNGGSGFNPGNGGSGFNPGNGGSGYNPGNNGSRYSNRIYANKKGVTPFKRPIVSPTPKPKVRPAPKPNVRPAPKPKVRPAPKPKVRPAPKPKVRPTPKPKVRT
ncbi:MAG: hypothetical protein MK188_12520, partial [Gammaproteobacteria bacterium]|nr:hypothetical protein [Gammaproteobacteria bacterium]